MIITDEPWKSWEGKNVGWQGWVLPIQKMMICCKYTRWSKYRKSQDCVLQIQKMMLCCKCTRWWSVANTKDDANTGNDRIGFCQFKRSCAVVLVQMISSSSIDNIVISNTFLDLLNQHQDSKFELLIFLFVWTQLYHLLHHYPSTYCFKNVLI